MAGVELRVELWGFTLEPLEAAPIIDDLYDKLELLEIRRTAG